jgi:uncharacterized membrane protein
MTSSQNLPPDTKARIFLRWALALGMIFVGVRHFTRPLMFVAMVPPMLPAPLFLVYLSGVAEIAGGVGLLIPRLRHAASLGLIALFIAVFPANVYMAIAKVPIGDVQPPTWALWARLPLQALFIAWAYWVGKRRSLE